VCSSDLDTWNIIGLNQPKSKVFIYDRHGKFIKLIIPMDSERGWDGTYEGNLLPSTDYWFSIEYIENDLQKIFKSHFTLKR
jgi:gliding motility-associated-like protein